MSSSTQHSPSSTRFNNYLPQDVLQKIFTQPTSLIPNETSWSFEERSHLRQMNVVCRAWAAVAQPLLFSKVTLLGEAKLARFTVTIELGRPELAKSIHALAVFDYEQTQIERVRGLVRRLLRRCKKLEVLWLFEFKDFKLSSLSHVRSVSVHIPCPNSTASSTHHLRARQTLQTLILFEVSLSPESFPIKFTFPKLTHLVFRGLASRSGHKQDSPLTVNFLQPKTFPSLTYLGFLGIILPHPGMHLDLRTFPNLIQVYTWGQVERHILQHVIPSNGCQYWGSLVYKGILDDFPPGSYVLGSYESDQLENAYFHSNVTNIDRAVEFIKYSRKLKRVLLPSGKWLQDRQVFGDNHRFYGCSEKDIEELKEACRQSGIKFWENWGTSWPEEIFPIAVLESIKSEVEGSY